MKKIDESNCFTYSDIELAHKGLPPAKYDAFVLFDPDDIEFATELLQKLESDGLTVIKNL